MIFVFYSVNVVCYTVNVEKKYHSSHLKGKKRYFVLSHFEWPWAGNTGLGYPKFPVPM